MPIESSLTASAESCPVAGGDPPLAAYRRAKRRGASRVLAAAGLLGALAVTAMLVGAYALSLPAILQALAGGGTGADRVVVWSVRMPRIVAAVLAGWGLALAGTVMQSLLRNPLVSPSTLGISHGAAFGAAFAIVVLRAGAAQTGALRTGGALLLTIDHLATTALCAFLGAMLTTGAILALARLRRLTPPAIILAGVALSSLFMSGTILMQYFASEVELASVVFWSFGDVARSNWRELGLVAVCTGAATAACWLWRWDLNALAAGDDAAESLGVPVERIRLAGMVLAALAAAVVTAFHGVIAFLGLLAPHISRRLVGANHTLLLPMSCLVGAILLVGADTAGRCLVGSGTLPVGILTSFMGAPVFLYLLSRTESA